MHNDKIIISDNLSDFSNKVCNIAYINTIENYLLSVFKSENFIHGEKRNISSIITVVFISAEGNDANLNILEAHNKYLDLHYTIQGADIIAWKKRVDCKNIRQEYDEVADYVIYNENPDGILKVECGKFCLISSDYAHMALYGECGMVKKMVFKIPFN